VEFIDPGDEECIVELCCGTGSVTMELARRRRQSRITASDISTDQIRVARWKAGRKNLPVDYSVQNAANTSYPSSSFDKVVVSAAFHEMTAGSRKAIYQEILRLLKPGGSFLLSEPERSGNGWIDFWLYTIVFNPWHPETKTVLEVIDGRIEQEIAEAGFTLVEKKQEKNWYFTCLRFTGNGLTM